MPRVIIIVPAEHQAAANAAAATLDPAGGELTFTVPLFNAGAPQTLPDAFWASAQMSPATLAQVTALAATLPGTVVEVWDAQANPVLPAEMLAARNLVTAL